MKENLMKRKIEFLDRLFKQLKCRQEILDFLKSEKLVNDDLVQRILHDNHQTHSTTIASLMEQLQKEDKLQLVSYEWTVLPTELLKLTLVTPLCKREWVYSV